jgi:hypothetical protein
VRAVRTADNASTLRQRGSCGQRSVRSR